MKIKIGTSAPDLDCHTNGDDTINLTTLKGKNIVLYFYPKDNTPGCTQESQDFRDANAKFKRRNTVVIGVSRDSVKSHDRFAQKHALPFTLIADTDEALCQIFSVMKDKNMFGKKVRGIERSTFLFDSKGILRQEWRKVKVDGHVNAVLDAVNELGK